MIDYKILLEACIKYGLNPTIVGESIIVNGHPINTYKTPFDFKTIGFPEEEMIQVVEIGKMIYNLRSQVVHFYDLSKEKGRLEYERDTRIKSIIVTMEDAMDFWLKSGLKKAKEQRKLIIFYGRVFEVDPSYYEKMKKMNDSLAEFHRDFQIKQANSEREAEKTILL